MSALPSDYPENDDEWGDENEAVWHAIAKFLNQELAAITTDRTAFEVSATRFNSYTVDVGLVRPHEFPPALIYPVAQAIRGYLREAVGYWRVRLHVMDATEVVLWLEIDRFGVYLSLGRVEQQRFSTLPEFYRHYWGTDFGVIV